MVKLGPTLRFLLVTCAITGSLCSCGGSSSSSNLAAVSTASWTNVSVRALDGKINVNWDKASGTAGGSTAATYNVYCSTTPSNLLQAGNRIATGYSGLSFDHTGAANGQRYYYVITAVTGAGEGPASRMVSATPQAAQVVAPFGLKVTAQDSSVRLDFLGPSGSSTAVYNLYRSSARNAFSAGNIIASRKPAAALSPYLDGNLTNGATYYYSATAVVDGKESSFGPVVSAQPQAAVPAVDSSPTQLAAFAPPSGVSAEPGNGSCIVRWTDEAPLVISGSDPAASTTPLYLLYWSYTTDVLNNPIGRLDNATKDATSGGATVSGLSNGSTYYFQLVAAVKGSDGNPISGRFTPGPVVSVTPAPKIPAVPTGVGAAQGSQQVLLSWDQDASGVYNDANGNSKVTYNIYYSTTDAATPAELMAKGAKLNNSDPTKPYFTHTGLHSGQTCYYVVTSVGEGESAPSSIISVTL